jgi:TonB family protein
MKIFASVISIVGVLAFSLGQGPQFEKQAVSLVQRTPVSTLEESMPTRPFGDWLVSVVGENAGIVWQLSECEQVEDGRGASADIPACVEANALLEDGRKVIVRVAVGTFKKGVTGDPGFFYAIIEQQRKLFSLNRLSDLSVGLRSPESLKENKIGLFTSESAAKAALGVSSASPVPANSKEEPPPPPTIAPRPEVRRVSSGVLLGNATQKVGPVYPQNAKKANVWGEVQVLITVAETGRVLDARAVNGPLLLRKAAVMAAREWTFSPTILNGKAVSSRGIITFDFPHP